MFFALMGLYAIVFEELGAAMYIRVFDADADRNHAVLVRRGAAIRSKMLTHYIVEIQQNLYFVGLVLTYLLWAAVLKLRETRVRVIQIVLSLGVYFSIDAANYALHNAYPGLRFIWGYVPPVTGMSAGGVDLCLHALR